MPDHNPHFARRMRSKLRREAHELLQPGPPSMQLLWPIGPQVPDDARVQEVLDLCMRIGEVLMSSGESVDETTHVMLRIAAACGLSAVDVDITFTSMTICCHRGMAAAPVTSMRLVQYRSLDLTRLLAVGRVIDRVEAGAIDVRTAATELSEAVSARHPYPRWVATVGWAGLAASIAILLGGALITGLTAFAVTAVIDRIGRVLNRRGLPQFFQQVVGGALATGATVTLFGLGAFPPGTRPSLVIAATITVLLSGLSVVGTVQDAITGYYVTAAGRAVEIALLSAGLLVGVVLGLRVGLEFAPPLEVAGELPSGAGRFGLSLAAAAAAAASFALAGYAPGRSLLAAAIAGTSGWSTYGLMVQVLGIGPVPATGIAAVVVGLAAGLFRRGGGVPPLVITLAGITPLLPGFSAYRGFYQLAVEGVADGLVTITLALGIGLALAAGVAFGDFLTGPRRPSGPAVSDPAPEGSPA
ncbi:threonine/serine exporter family protein [Pseudonocardia sp. KRD-184]|uniref:Threonine/serine exporter family protein n=1 Tax=Pseudonocardia oceani TaxID=2792013 RepID=A0ABS6UBC1_9PSEU|nr:threonine/serine exporter family protein [Pseudonocardia oceani]MBW0090555.1 threonine/serine exporter family protein [Pseudonocardia oceani]MBW0097704.1 threonine/serine exporter family protein [Pseudonocardia oceani]MBW0110282.1 threonine/serine exporter family protein [Pseudonocardia oceani]MBW0124414.1 threonine/serine exporter family protein [Pseudonocardia oceani]MBW0129268.1 threonine/serine exporter family protein [Pseudonocardia oceani]